MFRRLLGTLIALISQFQIVAHIQQVQADFVTMEVVAGNSVPTITVGPAETSESSSTNPVNVGSSVTWSTTAEDSSGEDYYLAVCSSDAVTPTNGGAPTCDATTWCVSSATNSGEQATCSYTTLAGNAESNAWYVFVCDGNASSANCSTTGNQGSGATGSPFEVNHAPSFTVYAQDGPHNPGQNVTFTSTSSDADISSVADTVKLVVCKTAGLTGDDCDGGVNDRWCASSLSASNPSCVYSIPSVTPDTSYSAYGYVIDSHNFGALGLQGTDEAYVVNNVAPVVSSVTLNGGAAIDLTEGLTTGVVLGATISDNNSCAGGELSTIYGYTYRSDVAYAGCDAVGESDNNFCYPEITCTVTGGTCTGTTDASANYTCTANLQYYADPTDTLTEYPGSNWLSTIKVIDNNAETDNTEVAAGVEMNSLTALDVTTNINYGSLDIGQKNDPLDKITTVTPTGNVGIDTELSGPANMCTDFPTCSGTTIAVNYVKYALASSTAYASGTSLSVTPTEVELNVAKDRTGSPVTKNVWWGIEIPIGTTPGSYTGSSTVGAYKGEIINW